jgi:hypothetical protein
MVSNAVTTARSAQVLKALKLASVVEVDRCA